MNRYYIFIKIWIINFLFLLSFSCNEEVVRDTPEIKPPPTYVYAEYLRKIYNYLDLGNGTILEFGTNLNWQKCSLGQTNDNECSGNATVFNSWEDAKLQCEMSKFLGKKWRLPKKNEYHRFIKSNYNSFFPNTQLSGVYCVRELSNMFLDGNNGTVTHKITKLIWQKCSIGQTNDKECSGVATRYSWDDAIKQCETLDLAGKKWRLPRIGELQTISIKDDSPSIDIRFFPNTYKNEYQSSSLVANNTNYNWYISFSSGYADTEYKTSIKYVRCVSDP